MDAFTDDRNPWLNALRHEDSRDYAASAKLYLDDAARCINAGSLTRAALSCCCAASCLTNLGDIKDAKTLYMQAALLHEKNSELAIGHSVRESIWSLLHAYEYYILVANELSAQRVSKRYIALARSIDDFGGLVASDTLKARRERMEKARTKMESSLVTTDSKVAQNLNRIHEDIGRLIDLARKNPAFSPTSRNVRQ